MHLIEQTETNAEMIKAESEQSLASERSTGKFLKYSKAFHKSSIPSILKYKNETADTDPLKAELFSNKSQSVKGNSEIPDPKPVTSGVPKAASSGHCFS